MIDKERFLRDSIILRYENSKAELLNISDKQLKSSYLPKVTLNTNAKYSNNQNKAEMNQEVLV